ncbi:type II secretion system protein [Methylobacterium sp. WL12]|uniref:type IV pilus modification PilV family protein n=2 Tax=unclassified Methylobacterium TaxID=2615210 RepID=UPI0011C96BF8|nr:prepilin-type N-terminal cleavage/methylation domain-containing protein [Methylobacterium sp. WL12]TXM72380.1 type II secretion system protein [Methylobacterium sp. WL12]
MSGRRPAPPAEPGEEGFTIVEVVVAFAITALAMIAAIEVSGAVAMGVRRVEAARVASDEAEGVVLARFAAGPPQAGVERGTFSDGSAWTLRIADAAPAMGLGRVPPLWLVRLSRGPVEGRPIYTTLVPGEIRE